MPRATRRWCSPGYWPDGRSLRWPTPDGLHTSYEPVLATVRVGQLVTAATLIGELVVGHPGCAAPACLHWGAMWGPASGADYVDPLGLLKATPIRLKPLIR